jgi:two-component system chemotaxis sensor kinase CheA
MDVVKTNIEKIGGTLDVQSAVGVGTTLKVKIPLTLAIVPALLVTCAGDRFAIPQVNLLELVMVEGEQVTTAIEVVHGTPVYRLRGRLLPLVYLNEQLGLPAPAERPTEVNIVVLQADDRQFGLVVDGICDTEEIVVKPLSKVLKALPTYAGATIMGDGRVALILDVVGIAHRAGVLGGSRQLTREEPADPAAAGNDSSTLLLLAQGDRQLAVPLALVSRMEELPATAVEQADGLEVVQYRGQIMPLLRLGGSAAAGDVMQVVVYGHAGKYAGLVVDRILDIVTAPSVPLRPPTRGGMLGSTVIQNRVTDLLDVPAIIQGTDPTFFDAPGGRT